MIDLECARCGNRFRRKLRAENYRIERGKIRTVLLYVCATRRDDPRSIKEPDPVVGARWVCLTRGRFALVDEDMFDALSARLWFWLATGKSVGYACSDDGKSRMMLHHAVLGVPGNTHVDHKNNNGLDCRRENLRLSNRSGNGANRDKFVGAEGREFTSRYKGVIDRSKHYTKTFVRNITKKASDYPWIARIRVNKKLIHIGRYATELEAARAYDAAALQHFGEFARPNFPSTLTETHPS